MIVLTIPQRNALIEELRKSTELLCQVLKGEERRTIPRRIGEGRVESVILKNKVYYQDMITIKKSDLIKPLSAMKTIVSNIQKLR
jgi:hypothetical protein